jgi:hypothetical protein
LREWLAGDAVLIAPVSKQIPWYQGILQGILLFWGSEAGLRCKKPLSCSGFSGNSLRGLSGKKFKEQGILKRYQGIGLGVRIRNRLFSFSWDDWSALTPRVYVRFGPKKWSEIAPQRQLCARGGQLGMALREMMSHFVATIGRSLNGVEPASYPRRSFRLKKGF